MIYLSDTRVFLIAAIALLLVAGTAFGQDRRQVLLLETNAPQASVYVDDMLMGRAARHEFIVPDSSRVLSLVAAGKSSWSIPPETADLSHYSGRDTIRIRIDFPHYYRFESTPYGALVKAAADPLAESLGVTPFTLSQKTPLTMPVVFSLDGYQEEELLPGRELWNLHAVVLQPLDGAESRATAVKWDPPKKHRKWIDYAALGTALVAGAVAVHFKFKADRRYDRYRETGDPDLRPLIKRYDVYSGVALGVMQAGLGVFAVRLVLR